MNLRDRLRLLKAAGASRAAGGDGTHGGDPVLHPSAAAQAEGWDLRVPGPQEALVGDRLRGFTVANHHGEAFYVESRYPVSHERGPLPLAAVDSVGGGAWSLLGRVPPHCDLRRAAYLDTETTGLAGGSGTYAFLVGLGFFAEDEFVVRQYFLRDFPEEEAMLEALTADLARFEVLVSFNGKSFDWPLMETRFRMARRRPPLAGAPHLDLLHPARRIWKERLIQCNLTNLEANILGVQRQGDVPGHLIPQLYFDYLRTGQVAPLVDVLLHNRLDILSLVSLAGWLGRIIQAPFSPLPDGELVCGDDLFSLGRLFEARGALPEAISCYEMAIERGLFAVSEVRAKRELSAAYKRVKAHDRAVSIWMSMIEGESALSLYPFVELAKFYEHTARDYPLATEMTQRALAIAERRRSLGHAWQREYEELRHRLNRLANKG